MGTASIQVLARRDLVAELDELAETDPMTYRRWFIAIRSINKINRGEDPDIVIAHTMPMLESGDGWQA